MYLFLFFFILLGDFKSENSVENSNLRINSECNYSMVEMMTYLTYIFEVLPLNTI